MVDVYARCYIYQSRTEIFISCVGPTCPISLAECIYRTRWNVFTICYISRVERSKHEWYRTQPHTQLIFFLQSPINHQIIYNKLDRHSWYIFQSKTNKCCTFPRPWPRKCTVEQMSIRRQDLCDYHLTCTMTIIVW